MKLNWLILSTGFALFAMFFGSGNLVFPIAVGMESEGHTFLASFGILLTGVIIPFLGVFGMMMYQGDTKSFFGCFGPKGTFWFSFLALGLMGPFGVLARCLTVAHGAVQLLFQNASLPITSFILCCLIFFLAANKGKIVGILGNLLTPFLLASIAAIAFFGLAKGSMNPPMGNDHLTAFKNGFLQGYQTMDLLAAFFFSTFIYKHLQKMSLSYEESFSFKTFCNASLLGGGILSLVYIALVLLGWQYSPYLRGVPPQELLGVIAIEALGSMAAPCVCVVVVLACVTTAIVLTSLFADFLRQEVLKEKIGNKRSLVVTLCIGFFVSTFEFSGIASFLGPILEVVYPALIVLTLFNIAHKVWGFRSSHWPVTVTLALKALTI